MWRAHGGRAPRGVIDFSSPQSPLGPPAHVREAIEDAIRSRAYESYPSYDHSELKEKIADRYNLEPSEVVLLNGSAEALPLLFLAIKPDSIITFEPTFGDTRALAIASRIPWVTLPYMRNASFSPRADLLCETLGHYSDPVVMLSNPNNPTGSLARRGDILNLLECMRRGFLVIDEAFADFTLDRESLIGERSEKIIVLRSLTKIFSIPGIRFGFMVAERGLARRIDMIRQPWNINSLAMRAAEAALEDWNATRRYVYEVASTVERERAFIATGLRSMGLKIYESAAPFLLAEHPLPHPQLNNRLVGAGVFVRDASTFHYLTPFHSRISVRLRQDNERLLEAFRVALGIA